MIQNVNSLNTLQKPSYYDNAKSIIAGGFLLILVLFSISCSNKKDEKIESSKVTFDECISLHGAVIYKNYLILVGENEYSDCSVQDAWYTVKYSKNTQIFVYDLLTDKRDDDFREVIQLDGLIRYYVRNDSLFAETRSNKHNVTYWWFLKDDKWIETNPFPSAERFNKSCLKKVCHQIFEDPVYVVYGFDQGEFGNAVLFLEKNTGIIRGYPMRSARKALKDSSGYLILGICYHMMESFEVLRIPHPELLPIVPDSLIGYNCPDNEDFEQNDLDNYLKDQIIRSFPEKICKKINIAKSSEYIYRDDSILFNESASHIYQSLYYEYDNYSSAVLLQNDPEVTCKSIFTARRKLYCILEKYDFSSDSTCFFIAEINNLSTEKVLNKSIFVVKSPVKWVHSISSNNSVILVFNYSDHESHCHKFTCIIINDKFIKTYHFSPH